MESSISFRHSVFQDCLANQNSLELRLLIAFFRQTQFIANRPSIVSRLLDWISVALYSLFAQRIMVIELLPSASGGKDLQLFYGVGLVVSPDSVIGEGCILGYCTTFSSIDITGFVSPIAPVLGHHVDVACNVVKIGPISVGNYSVIGTGLVIVHDVPEYAVVCGNQEKVIVDRSSKTGSKVNFSAVLEVTS